MVKNQKNNLGPGGQPWPILFPPSSIAKANKLAPIYTIVNTLDRGEIIIIIIIRRGEERIELQVELWKWLEL